MTRNIRPTLTWFTKCMEEKLKENDHKGTWIGCHPDWLFYRLAQEVEELQETLFFTSSSEQIIREAADVANFAMMIADVVRHKGATQRE